MKRKALSQKLLAMAIMAAMLLALTPVVALADVPNVTVYFSGFSTIPNPNPKTITVTGSTVEDAYVQVMHEPYPKEALYMLNGEMGMAAADVQTLSSGDYVVYYFVSDYTTQYYAAIDPYTLLIVDGRIKLLRGTTVPLVSEQIGFNFDDPVMQYTNATFTDQNQNTITVIDDSVTGVSVLGQNPILTSYYPVDLVDRYDAYSNRLNDEATDVKGIAQAAIDSNELTPAAETTLTSDITAIDAAGTDYAAKFTAIHNLEVDVRALDASGHNHDARIAAIAFDQSVAVALATPFNPDRVSYEIDSTTGTPFVGSDLTLTVTPKASGATYEISADNGATVSGDTVTFTQNGSTAITVTVTNSTATRAYTFVLDVNIPSPGGTTPSAVDGYLPMGQYASGASWGSISNDNANSLDYPSISDYDRIVKGISGYTGAGVSLGAAGGYVQYEFAQPITNQTSNAYGVDFIVYGNAFGGNSEAGAVQVSYDGITWYELAGALYYDDDTQRNVQVDYQLDTTDPDAPVINYQFGPARGNPFHSWIPFVKTAAWWPRYAAKPTGENYGAVAGVPGYTPHPSPYPPATAAVNGVTYSAGNVMTYGYNVNDSAYQGITLVKATRDTAAFPFGYADVHTDGSNYGTAGNPYTAEGGFGDGFDLSWAVDASGAPVNLPNGIKFVRIYTASVLDPKDETHTTFQLPDVFGEISTEVLGVYVTANTGSGNITADPTVMVGGNTLADLVADEAATVETIGTVTYYDASEYSSVYFETEATITASAPAGTSVYINSDTSGSMPFDFSVKSIIARIIAKDASTGIPSIIVIKLA